MLAGEIKDGAYPPHPSFYLLSCIIRSNSFLGSVGEFFLLFLELVAVELIGFCTSKLIHNAVSKQQERQQPGENHGAAGTVFDIIYDGGNSGSM